MAEGNKNDLEFNPEDVQGLLDSIIRSLEENPDCKGEFINEFGDYTIAIPISGGQEALNNVMAKQKLEEALAYIAEDLVTQISHSSNKHLTCCFTGHRPEKVAWLSEESDVRLARLEDTIKPLIDNLSMRGFDRFITGNALGFDQIAAEMVLESNAYLGAHKSFIEALSTWNPAELEIAIPFDGHNSNDPKTKELQERASRAHVVSHNRKRTEAFMERNIYMVDNSDLVIALLDDESQKSSGTLRTINYAMNCGKPIITFWTRWFGDGWPDPSEISVMPPKYLKNLDVVESRSKIS